MKLKSGLSFSFVFKFLFEGFKRALFIVLFGEVGEVTGLEDDGERDLAFEDRLECPLVVLGSFAFGLVGDADFEVAGLIQSYAHDPRLRREESGEFFFDYFSRYTAVDFLRFTSLFEHRLNPSQ